MRFETLDEIRERRRHRQEEDDPLSRTLSDSPYVREPLLPRNQPEAEGGIGGGHPLQTRVANLASSLGRAKKRITDPLLALGRGVEDVAIKPAIAPQTVRKLVERFPVETVAAALKSPVVEDEGGVPRLLPQTRPTREQALKAVEVGAEFGPSWLDLATGGASKGLGLGLAAIGAGVDFGKGAKATKKAGEIVRELKALEKASIKGEKAAESARVAQDIGQLGHPIGTEKRMGRILGTPEGRLIPLETTLTPSRLGPGGRQAEIVGEASKGARPILETGPGGVERQRLLKKAIEEEPMLLEYKPRKVAAPMAGRGVSQFDVGLAQIGKTPDDFLREIGGRSMVPREAAEGIANAARNLQLDTQKKANEGASSLDALLRPLKKLKGKDRVRVERALASRLDFGVETGSKVLDDIADQIDGWQRSRFDELASTLEAAGKERPRPREFYLTHRNERLGDAIRKYQGDTPGAIDDVEALYRESGVKPPPRQQIEEFMDGLYHERNIDATGGRNRIASKASHVEEARTLDVPGYVADVRRKDFKSGDLVRTLEDYNQETAFRLADIRHFGADAEKFTDWNNSIGNRDVQKYVQEYRQHLLHALSDDPLEAEAGKFLSAIRSYQAANKLGRAAISNVFQTAVTTLPKSMNTVGLKGAANYARSFVQSLPSLLDKGDALVEARRAGAVYDHSVADIAGIAHKGFFGRLADTQLKVFGFVPTERFNNTLSFHAGRYYGEDLAKALRGGNQQAAEEARRLLSATPEAADEFMRRAVAGEEIGDEILDRMGFEFARTTQFRADPTTLPLKWVTPGGQTLFQFKNFGYQYNRFLINDVFKPALNGDVAPLAAWMVAGGITGPAMTWGRKIAKDPLAMKRLLDEDPAEREKFEKAINEEVTLQQLGLWGDALSAGKRTFFPEEGPQESKVARTTAIPEFLLGPTFGEVARLPKELVGYGMSPERVAARRLPIGPFVPAAERLSEGVDLSFGGQGVEEGYETIDAIRARRAARR